MPSRRIFTFRAAATDISFSLSHSATLCISARRRVVFATESRSHDHSHFLKNAAAAVFDCTRTVGELAVCWPRWPGSRVPPNEVATAYATRLTAAASMSSFTISIGHGLRRMRRGSVADDETIVVGPATSSTAALRRRRVTLPPDAGDCQHCGQQQQRQWSNSGEDGSRCWWPGGATSCQLTVRDEVSVSRWSDAVLHSAYNQLLIVIFTRSTARYCSSRENYGIIAESYCWQGPNIKCPNNQNAPRDWISLRAILLYRS